MPKKKDAHLCEIRNMTDTSADIYFYGDIVSDWWGAWQAEDQYPDNIKNMLAAADGRDLNIYINSGGGEVGNGLALYDVMQYISSPVRTVCVGLAASMAAVLFAAGDRREMFSHSKVMIHDPSISGRMTRNALELQVMSQDLMDTRRSLAEILAKHTGRTAEEILEKTVTDCFFDAESAIEFGLADSIIA